MRHLKYNAIKANLFAPILSKMPRDYKLHRMKAVAWMMAKGKLGFSLTLALLYPNRNAADARDRMIELRHQGIRDGAAAESFLTSLLAQLRQVMPFTPLESRVSVSRSGIDTAVSLHYAGYMELPPSGAENPTPYLRQLAKLGFYAQLPGQSPRMPATVRELGPLYPKDKGQALARDRANLAAFTTDLRENKPDILDARLSAGTPATPAHAYLTLQAKRGRLAPHTLMFYFRETYQAAIARAQQVGIEIRQSTFSIAESLPSARISKSVKAPLYPRQAPNTLINQDRAALNYVVSRLGRYHGQSGARTMSAGDISALDGRRPAHLMAHLGALTIIDCVFYTREYYFAALRAMKPEGYPVMSFTDRARRLPSISQIQNETD